MSSICFEAISNAPIMIVMHGPYYFYPCPGWYQGVGEGKGGNNDRCINLAGLKHTLIGKLMSQLTVELKVTYMYSS